MANLLWTIATADDRDDRPLLLHKTNESPPGYRVRYDGVEIGSISETVNHVTKLTFWRWGVDTMPLMTHGGRPPSGQALTLDDAKAAFRHAFFIWLDDLAPGVWERNRDYKRVSRTAPSPG